MKTIFPTQWRGGDRRECTLPYIIKNKNQFTHSHIYNYKNLKTTYYNSSVIGDIVDKYLSGDISKEKFIRQLTAATEIYLTE